MRRGGGSGRMSALRTSVSKQCTSSFRAELRCGPTAAPPPRSVDLLNEPLVIPILGETHEREEADPRSLGILGRGRARRDEREHRLPAPGHDKALAGPDTIDQLGEASFRIRNTHAFESIHRHDTRTAGSVMTS